MKTRTTVLTLLCSLIVPLVLVGQVQATSIPTIFPINVLPGEKFVIQIEFPTFPTNSGGDADLLLISGGAGSLGVTSVRVNLYGGNNLLAFTDRPGQTNVFGFFAQPGSLYTQLATTADLSTIFNGTKKGTFEVIPTFDNQVQGAFVVWELSFLEAYRGTGPNTYTNQIIRIPEDEYPAPVLVNTAIVSVDCLPFPGGGQTRECFPGPAPIPEPSTMLLFGTGLAGLAAWHYRKSVKV